MTITTSVPAGAEERRAATRPTRPARSRPSAQDPRRISARMSVTLEDVAAIGQANFESALRQNASR